MATYQHLTSEQVDHFLEHGYLVVKGAFPKEKAAEWTKDIWVRLGMDPNDKKTWNRERIHLPYRGRTKVAEFAPKAWEVMKELSGGGDRLDEQHCTWGDGFIVNLGTDQLEGDDKYVHPCDLDGDFFVHYLDSSEQGLLVIPIFSDIKPRGGGTFICTDALSMFAQYLAAHPEGVLPVGGAFVPSTSTHQNPKDDPHYWSPWAAIKKCGQFVEMTGDIGDVILLHPLMLHSAAKNHTRVPRIITNPPVKLKQPFKFSRKNQDEYSLVELKTLRAIGVNRLDFKITTERKRIVPKRLADQK